MNFPHKRNGSAIILLTLYIISIFSACRKAQVTYEDFKSSNILVQTVWPDPDNSTQSFYLDTLKLNYFSSLQFLTATDYMVVISGSRKAEFFNNSSSTTLTSESINLEPDKAYSLFLTGTADAPESVFTEDDLTPPGYDKFKVRFANMSYGQQNVDLEIQSEDTTAPQPKPVISIASSIAYKTVSPFTVVDTSGSTFRIDVRDGITHNLLVSIPGNKAKPNQAYTVTLAGIQGNAIGLTLSTVNNVFSY